VCIIVPNIVAIDRTVGEIWRVSDFSKWPRPPSWIFKIGKFQRSTGLKGFVVPLCAGFDHPRRAFVGGLYHCAKFGWNRCSSFDNIQVLMYYQLGSKTPILTPKFHRNPCRGLGAYLYFCRPHQCVKLSRKYVKNSLMLIDTIKWQNRYSLTGNWSPQLFSKSCYYMWITVSQKLKRILVSEVTNQWLEQWTCLVIETKHHGLARPLQHSIN